MIEKDETLGGLCCADTIDGIVTAKASAYPSFPFNDDMVALYQDLGFITVTQGKITVNPRYVLQPPYDQLFSRGKWVVDPFDDAGMAELPISQKARDDLAALIETLEELWEWEDAEGLPAFDCPPDDASRDPKLRGLDDMTLGEYAQAQGWDLEMIRLFDPLLRSAYGVGHDRISAWAALDILTDELLPADEGESALGFPGGNAFFAEALAHKVAPGQALTGAIVSEIRQGADEVQVTCVRRGQAETRRGRAAIFAAPQFMAPYLLPDLPADRQQAAKTFEYTPYFRAHPQVLADFTASERLPLQVFMMQGICDYDVANTRQWRNFHQEKGYALEYIETSDGHSWGNWRGMMDDMLRFFCALKECFPFGRYGKELSLLAVAGLQVFVRQKRFKLPFACSWKDRGRGIAR